MSGPSPGKIGREVITLPFAAAATEQLRQLTYAPLPWETHPIDLAYGSQGWGPMMGPWQPSDFVSQAAGIDITYASGDNNEVRAPAPGYGTLTLFHDDSLNRVHNSSLLATLAQAASGASDRLRSGAATISNGRSQQDATDGTGASLGRLRSLLGISE